MARTLVTGATGFLGGAVVTALRGNGIDVIGTGRDEQKCAALGFVPIDLSRPPDRWPDLGPIDHIVHCAGLSAPFGRYVDFVRGNEISTRNIVKFAESRNVKRLVHISTSSVYFAPRDQLDVTENSVLPRPINAYAATKRAAEKIVLAAPDIGPIVLRPRGIYGVGDTALLPRLLRVAAQRPLPIFRNGTAAIDLTHVDDVVASVIAAINAPDVDGIVNISGGELLPIRDIVNQASARAGVVVKWCKQPLGLAMGLGAILETIARIDPLKREPLVTRYALGLFAYQQSLSIEKAKMSLDWAPQVSFAEGLERTFLS